MSAFFPQHSHPPTPIPASQALSLLQTYLETASSTPYLLPSCILTPTGPTALDASSSLTLHNLRRVEAGLRGEIYEPPSSVFGSGKGEEGEDMTVLPDEEEVRENGRKRKAEEEGWMDLGEYQREQSELGDEVVETQPEADGVVVEEEDKKVVETNKGVDREERKALKKARAKEEKARKEREKRRKIDV